MDLKVAMQTPVGSRSRGNILFFFCLPSHRLSKGHEFARPDYMWRATWIKKKATDLATHGTLQELPCELLYTRRRLRTLLKRSGFFFLKDASFLCGMFTDWNRRSWECSVEWRVEPALCGKSLNRHQGYYFPCETEPCAAEWRPKHLQFWSGQAGKKKNKKY